jgi:hypothetical protein
MDVVPGPCLVSPKVASSPLRCAEQLVPLIVAEAQPRFVVMVIAVRPEISVRALVLSSLQFAMWAATTRQKDLNHHHFHVAGCVIRDLRCRVRRLTKGEFKHQQRWMRKNIPHPHPLVSWLMDSSIKVEPSFSLRSSLSNHSQLLRESLSNSISAPISTK